ncbi:PilZ domain-containing protein [Pseudodesulfovibrio cashew]|uniref:PilZ domain-containing protein n=1 Tax=Pseudodesulfovibrio cashew TaxID=2678688 RepID=A0A6I6JKL7_9BACT|nr:PilZ domain-containing protein [Pseudodesulfovibrio cashew]QGY41518.1 PilZ domain-containing protein [Pseudodesulfovibrio cashew]
MGFDLELSTNSDGQLRQAFRTKVPGLTVRFAGMDGVLEVKDLSATGFAVLDSGRGFSEGGNLVCDLLINSKLFLGELKARVIRVLDNGIVGINFEELSRQQQAKLDKLVLEVQKRLIALRKQQREQE